MEHWFDGLAKKLADGDMSRRTFLGGMAALFGALAIGEFGSPANGARPARAGARLQNAGATARNPAGVTANGNVAQPVRFARPFNIVSLTMGPCTYSRKGKREERMLVSTSTSGAQTITVHEMTSTGPLQTQHNLRVDVNGKMQCLVVRRKAKEGGNLTLPALAITIGPAFGFKDLKLTSQDGKTLQGKINGRAITPLDATAFTAQTQVQFADGQPAPKIAPHPQLVQAIRAAIHKAGEDARLCVPSGAAAGSPTPFVGGAPRGPVAESGADAGFSKGCQACFNKCYTAYNSCYWTSAGECTSAGPFWAVCMGIKMSVDCGPNQDACENACAYSPTCCPITCDNAPPSNGPGLCCSEGFKCVDPTNGYCCPDGYNQACADQYCECCPGARAICAGVCCGAGQACSQENICCHQTQFNTKPVSCGGKCCGAGQKCIQGPVQSPVCCPEKQACGGACCEKPCKNGKCCDGTWCGDLCCTYGCTKENKCKPNPLCLTGKYINGKCCPFPRVCGNVCCLVGQHCLDQQAGTCGKPNCGAGQKMCLSQMSDETKTAICCPGQNPVCCNAKCCNPGQKCCLNSSGVLGCFAPSDCGGVPIK